ncbi:MAG: 30S ribosomal protein S14 [Pseudomonadota bacterium]|nr:30S ribosomal protein S14 [Pseudomonadota bacterium]
MAKTSAIEKNARRKRIIEKYAKKRADLKKIASDKTVTLEERFDATQKLAEMPRNSSAVRYRNRCQISGRPRAYYRKFKMSRIALRELASIGYVPGVTKSSW